MFSKSQIAFLVVAAVAVVEGFAPVAQPRFATSTELGAFFFQKTAEKSPTLSLEPETKSKFSFGKKAPVEKVVEKKTVEKKAPFSKFSFGKKGAATETDAKKAPVKKVVAKKFNGNFGKKPTKSKQKLTIYE